MEGVNKNGGSPVIEDESPLVVEALSSLHEFHNEQEIIKNVFLESGQGLAEQRIMESDLSKFFPEDWQISQFWYDQDTTKFLVKEVKRVAGTDGKVACISCPSVFRCCELNPNVHLFEFDRRFAAFGESFHFYDYKLPEDIPKSCVHKFSVIILDPPFLTADCLENMAKTVKILANEDAKIILCTGAQLEKEAEQYLSLKKSTFIPKHRSNGIRLAHEFGCFVNFDINFDVDFEGDNDV